MAYPTVGLINIKEETQFITTEFLFRLCLFKTWNLFFELLLSKYYRFTCIEPGAISMHINYALYTRL